VYARRQPFEEKPTARVHTFNRGGTRPALNVDAASMDAQPSAFWQSSTYNLHLPAHDAIAVSDDEAQASNLFAGGHLNSRRLQNTVALDAQKKETPLLSLLVE